jgi:alpha-glucosidase
MFHTSLTGTLFIYQGEEIGLCNVPRDWAEEEYKDIETIQALDGERDFRWKQNGKKGDAKEVDVSDVLRDMRWTARDNGRTPMQVSSRPRLWNGS